MISDKLDNVARKAADAASRVLKVNYGRVGATEVEHKAKNDFVSFVDREAERAIIDVVRESFPDHSFLTEEDQAGEATSG